MMNRGKRAPVSLDSAAAVVQRRTATDIPVSERHGRCSNRTRASSHAIMPKRQKQALSEVMRCTAMRLVLINKGLVAQRAATVTAKRPG